MHPSFVSEPIRPVSQLTDVVGSADIDHFRCVGLLSRAVEHQRPESGSIMHGIHSPGKQIIEFEPIAVTVLVVLRIILHGMVKLSSATHGRELILS